MGLSQKKYNITDKQEMLGIKSAVQEVAENICCFPEWCTVEKVVNIDSSQKEIFSHYAVSATAVDIPSGEDKQVEIAHLTTNGHILRDYEDLHPELFQYMDEVNSPDVNPDLINEYTVIKGPEIDFDGIEEPFDEL